MEGTRWNIPIVLYIWFFTIKHIFYVSPWLWLLLSEVCPKHSRSMYNNSVCSTKLREQCHLKTLELPVQESGQHKGHFVAHLNCLVLGHTKYKGVQLVYCNLFPEKQFHGSHRLDLVMIRQFQNFGCRALILELLLCRQIQSGMLVHCSRSPLLLWPTAVQQWIQVLQLCPFINLINLGNILCFWKWYLRLVYHLSWY
jgi:hypothetical protein